MQPNSTNEEISNLTTTKKEQAPQEEAEGAAIVIDAIAAETVSIPIVSTSPLIMHRFSEKSKRQMLDAMQGRKTPREPKDPEAEYRGALYYLKDSSDFGFPATAFKLATVGGARFYGSDVTMVSLRQSMFFRGEPGDDGTQLVPIQGECWMREDVVRVGRGGTDLRYRPQFDEWSATLQVTYVKAMLTRASLVSLIDAGGMGVGIGEWRVERDGDYGTYRVDPARTIEVLS